MVYVVLYRFVVGFCGHGAPSSSLPASRFSEGKKKIVGCQQIFRKIENHSDRWKGVLIPEYP
jgi:hypothetical protein